MRRRGLRFLLIAVALVAIGVLLGPWLVPDAVVRDLVVDRLTATLQRPVTVASVQARLWPRPHVVLKGLAVGAAAPGAGQSLTEFSLRNMDLTLAWGPLLERRVEVVELALTEPRIVVRAPDPADTGSPPGPGPDIGAPPEGPSVGVRIDQFTVRDGALQVLRSDGRPVLEIAGLAETLTLDVAVGGEMQVAGVTTIDTLRIHLPQGTLGDGLAVSWEKDFGYDPRTGRLTVAASTLHLGDLPLTVTGRLDSLAAARPVADLELTGGPVPVTSLLGYLPSHLFPQLEGVASQGDVALRATLKGPLAAPRPRENVPFAYDLHFELARGRLEHPALAAPVRDIDMSVRARDGSLTLETMSAATSNSRMFLSGSATDLLQSPRIDLSFAGDLDLAEMSALQSGGAGGTRMSGRLAAEGRMRGLASDPASWLVDGWARLTDASAAGPEMAVPLTDLNGRVELQGGILNLDDVHGRLGNSDFRLQGTVRDYLALVPPRPDGSTLVSGPADLQVRLFSDRIDVDQFAGPDARGGPVASDPGAQASARAGVGRLALLSGRVDVVVKRVLARGHDLDDVTGTVLLDRGRLQLEGVAAGLYGGSSQVTGVVDLRDPARGRIDLQVTLQSVQAAPLSTRSLAMSRFARLAGCLTGLVSGQATLQGALNDTFGLDLGTFSSGGEIELNQARLTGHPLQQKLAGYLSTPDLETLAIERWLQPFRIEDGKLHVDGLELVSGDMMLRGAGWQALDGALSLGFELTLPQRLAAGVRSLLPGTADDLLLDGSEAPVVLPLTVSGRVEAPRVGLDVAALTTAAETRARTRVQDESERAVDRLRDEATRRLRDLAGVSADSAGADSTAADSVRTEDPVRDGLRSLLDELGGGRP